MVAWLTNCWKVIWFWVAKCGVLHAFILLYYTFWLIVDTFYYSRLNICLKISFLSSVFFVLKLIFIFPFLSYVFFLSGHEVNLTLLAHHTKVNMTLCHLVGLVWMFKVDCSSPSHIPWQFGSWIVHINFHLFLLHYLVFSNSSDSAQEGWQAFSLHVLVLQV